MPQHERDKFNGLLFNCFGIPQTFWGHIKDFGRQWRQLRRHFVRPRKNSGNPNNDYMDWFHEWMAQFAGVVVNRLWMVASWA